MASPSAPEYFYSSTAPRMALAAPVTNTGTTLTVDSVAGLPGSLPFKLVLDPGLSGEEIVKVNQISGTTLTVIRGWDGTAAQSHANLAEVRHAVTAEDLRLSREHESSWRDVHGVNGFIVGTTDQQTLTNKDLSSSTNAFPADLARDTEVAAAVATHAALTKSHGVTGVLVGTTDTQTLTNKTLSGASNTFSAIPKTAITGITGSIVDTDSAQTLTNKTLNDPVLTGAVTGASAAFSGAVSAASVTSAGAVSGTTGTFSGNVTGPNLPASTATVAGKRMHWFKKTGVVPNSTGYATITHGCGFTPTVVVGTSEQSYTVGVDPTNINGTTFQVRLLNPIADVAVTTATDVMFFCGE